MLLTPRAAYPLLSLAIACMAGVVTGCASTPPPTAAGTPASAAELRDLGDFTKKARDAGWKAQVQDGQVLYCSDETPVNSRLPEQTCLTRTGLEQVWLAAERQRQQLQLQTAGAMKCGMQC